MTTTTVTLTTAILTSIFTVIPLLVGVYLKLQEVLKPLLARRRAVVRVLFAEPGRQGATAFVATLRAQGYREVSLTQSYSACAGARAVVLWHPSAEAGLAASTVGELRRVAPEATVLVLTHERLTLTLGEQVLLSNSQARLRGDLATVAELP